jgi:hypothetical protein
VAISRSRRLAVAEELRLEVRKFKDLSRWGWVLTDAVGGFLADHEVRLDPASWQFEAFADLQHYVSWHAAPDRYREDEARIVAGLGSWVGTHVLGPPIADALARAARRGAVTVRAIVPRRLEACRSGPWKSRTFTGDLSQGRTSRLSCRSEAPTA